MSIEMKSLIADKNTTDIKRSLILAGGGMRLAYQAGVLQGLEEAGLQFTHVDGTSGGIFNIAMLASGLSPREMAKRWRNLEIKNFMSYRPAKEYFKITKLIAFGDADGIREKIFPSLGIDLQKINANQRITATFNVCNFSTKSIEAISNDEVTEDHLLAGISLPIFMPAIKIKNDWYSDAVWIKDANLLEAVKRGAEELWLVWAIGNNNDYLPGSFNQYVHMIEMSANGGLLEEYAQINFLNERILKGDSPYGQKKPIRLFVIKPEFPLPLDPDLFFDKINTDTLINMGYEDSKKYLGKTPFEDVVFDNRSTKMKEPGVTLSFRQLFTGELTIGGKNSSVSFCPSFNLRKWDNSIALYHQSSILLEALGERVSTKNNSATIKQNGRSAIEINSEFELDGHVVYNLKGIIELSSSLDWFLGLEFKRINISITKKDSSEIVTEGYLTQSISDRLKSIFSTSLRNFHAKGTKTKEKYNMISKLYKHEI